MKGKRIKIPAGLAFHELRLAMDPRTNRVKYRPDILAPVIRANNLQLQTLTHADDVAERLIGRWYLAHLSAGGNPDLAAEQLLNLRRRR
jgi:hypothetical protein